MRSADLAPLLVAAAAGPDLGFRQATVVSWDSLTGENVIDVAGSTFTDLPVISSADSVLLTTGDVVGVLRFKSTYLVLGRIGVAGQGAPGISGTYVAAEETTTSAAYTDLATPGPVVTVFIGSSRRCLVLLRSSLGVSNSVGAAMSFEVSGASSISAAANGQASAFLAADSAAISGTSLAILSAAEGLNEGQNTFTAKYSMYTGTTGPAKFKERQLIVFPF